MCAPSTSASYYYSLVALSPNSEVSISTYFQDSLQGDSALQTIYKESFGVTSSFENGKLTLTNNPDFKYADVITLDLNNTPDIAQTIAATCVGLGSKCHLMGLETSKIKKETCSLKNSLMPITFPPHLLRSDSLPHELFQ